MRIVSTIEDATEVAYGDVVYKASEDGTFDVPEEVGRELTGFPNFDEEWVARDRELARVHAEESDSVLQARKLREMEERLAVVEGLLAQAAAPAKRTRRTKAEMEADAADEADAEPDASDD